jgi:hypothetical protein
MLAKIGLDKKFVAILIASLLTLGGVVAVTQVVGFSEPASAATLPNCTSTATSLPFDGDSRVITNAEELKHFSISQSLYRTTSVVLRPSSGSIIDISDCNWLPVGSFSAPFEGSFDGGASTISFSVSRSERPNGFFGSTNSGATIQDLDLTGSVAGTTEVGGLSGEINGSTLISNASFRGTVEGAALVGGLVGAAYNSTIHRSFSSGTVTQESQDGSTDTFTVLGGLVGYFDGSSNQLHLISESYSNADVVLNLANEDVWAGGLVGYLYGGLLVEDSFSSGRVEVASISGNKKLVGGSFLGEFGGKLSGANVAQIRRVYSAGAVDSSTAAVTRIGFFIGEALEYLRVSNSVFRIGEDVGHEAAITKSIALMTANDTFIENLMTETTDRMKDQATFEALGWDFDTVWKMSAASSEFNGFPVLQWQDVQSASASSANPASGTGAPSLISSVTSKNAANLNRKRSIELLGSNLDQVSQAIIGGQFATLDSRATTPGKLAFPSLPLLPSGTYTMTLLTASGSMAGTTEIVIKARIEKIRKIEGSGLTRANKTSVNQTLRTYPTAQGVRCVGMTTDRSAAGLAEARVKAQAACEFAVMRNPALAPKVLTKVGSGKPAQNEVVRLRFKK